MPVAAKIGIEAISRRSPFEAGRTAVLVVDMQKEFCVPGNDAQHPELDEGCYFHHRLKSTVLPNQVKLLKAARRYSVEIVYTVIESLTKDGRDRSPDHKLSGIHVPRGSEGARMPDEIVPLDDEIVLPKTSSGVFNSTNIDYVLRNLGNSVSDCFRHCHRPVRRHGSTRCRRPGILGNHGGRCFRNV